MRNKKKNIGYRPILSFLDTHYTFVLQFLFIYHNPANNNLTSELMFDRSQLLCNTFRQRLTVFDKEKQCHSIVSIKAS